MVKSAKIGERAGQRTVLLWVLWIVMTLLLLAAGVAVLGSEVAAPMGQGAGAAPMPRSSPVEQAEDTEAVVAPAAVRQLVDVRTYNEVPVRARVRMRLDVGGHSVPMPRGLRVDVSALRTETGAAARGNSLGHEQPPTPWTFAVPAGTARLRFQTWGFTVVEVAMPVATDGVADLGSITLRAEAAIRLRLLHVPAAFREGALVTVDTLTYGAARLAAVPLAWREDGGEAVLPAPTGQQLFLQVQLPAHAGRNLRLPDGIDSAVASLQRGETRLLELDCTTLPASTFQIVGIADELLPHVEIAMHEPGRKEQLLTPDAAGRVQLLGVPSAGVAFTVHSADPLVGDIGLRNPELLGWFGMSAGTTCQLRPDEPLIGIGMRDGKGQTVPFRLGLGHPVGDAEARELQIVGEQQLRAADILFVATDVAKRSLAPATLLGAGAVRWITPAVVTALSTLRVRPTTPLPEQHGFSVVFEALDGRGDKGSLLLQGDSFVSEQMLPGRYRIALWYRDSRAFDIAADIDLRPGSVTELPLELPAVDQWRGEIANWSELSAELRPHQVFVEGARVNVAKDGSLLWWRAGELAADIQVTVGYFQSSQRLPGRVLDVDSIDRRVRIEAPGDLVQLQLRAEGLGDGMHCFTVAHPDGREVVESQYGEFWLPPTASACGYTWETLRGIMQVTAWFALPAGTTTASIPTGVDAHWLAVAVQRPAHRVIVRLRGPAGHPIAKIAELPQRGAVQVLVVAGTRSIEVDTDGDVQSFDAAGGDIVIR